MSVFFKTISVILVVLFVIMIPVSVVLKMFDNTISLMVPGSRFWKLQNEGSNLSDSKYGADYGSEEERLAAGHLLAYNVEAEGAALLLNKDNALPLAEGAKVSTLSSNSVNLVYGGTGSGNVDASKALDLKEALEKSGFEVNATLWNSYFEEQNFFQKLLKKDPKPLYDRSASEGESAVLAGQAGIAEAPISHYTEEITASIGEYGDAAIITFSRIGGEGYDCAFPGYVNTKGEVATNNYLELNSVELDLLKYAEDLKKAGSLKKIVVLLNCSNAIELDFLDKYDIDACLWVGGLGISGTEAVADILAGKVNPSGSLPDTYLKDNFTSPAMQNFLATQYELEDGVKVPDAIDTYMVYQEGIYVGYKYYETRYEDLILGQGNANFSDFVYDNEVAFPFGHGLSYTNFVYDNLTVEFDETARQYTISVRVTNAGSVAGKEPVQIYLQSPYTDYDKANKVEKASVQLIGFAKTGVIEPGANETVTIVVDQRDMAAYDSYGKGTYILDEGDYYFTAATDSHNAINNILAVKGREELNGNKDLVHTVNITLGDEFATEFGKVDAVSFSTSLNGTEIKNQLDGSDPNKYYGEGTVKFLSRQDWKGTWPTGDYKLKLTAQMVKELDNRYDNELPIYEEMVAHFEEVTGRDWHTMPILDEKNGLTLYDMFTADYDENGVPAYRQYNDPAWDKLLRNLSMEELISIGDCFHWRHPVASVNAPGSRDENGPQGLTVALFGSGLQAEATAFPSEDVMAATFNTVLMNEVGKMIGNDCIDAGVSCLYGPGANTHRTPYGGRNFEYYSEDGFLAGEIGYAEVNGILSKGVDVVMKHFALNDSEQDRLGQAAWLTEQAAREIYLKGFQKALEENGGRGGIMTAYTRWGTTWSGANYGLMTGILREEWGNNSMHITDNMITANCNAIDAIMAGGVTCFDAMMTYATNDIKTATDDPVFVNAMVEAMHRNLYTIINSAAMKGVGADTTVKTVTPPLIIIAPIVAVVFGVVGIFGLYATRVINFRRRYFF